MYFFRAMFGEDRDVRMRTSFFPFTEPSAEVLISCIFCGGGGYQGSARCPNCKASGWIELLNVRAARTEVSLLPGPKR